MQSLFKYILLMVMSLLCNCTSKTDYKFIESQSNSINTYREEGYYEYASRLNTEMWGVLKNNENNLFKKETLETLERLSIIVSDEKDVWGCYIIPWNTENKSFLNDIIMLEWNADAGAVIRFFTKSKSIFDMLPESSY